MNKQKCVSYQYHTMDKVVNLISLTGWTYLLVNLQVQLIFDLQGFITSDFTFQLQLLQVIQLFQITDILLILLGKSKGSLVGAFFQILGRNIVALIFMQPESHKLKFAAVVILWAIADINRYLYYLFKNNSITAFLRYNSFLVLYPLGGLAQMVVINDYISRHPELQPLYVYIIRFIQGSIILGVIFLYNYMLKSRKKHFSSLKNKEGSTQSAGAQSQSNKKQQKTDKKE